jgi:hypothetical protein
VPKGKKKKKEKVYVNQHRHYTLKPRLEYMNFWEKKKKKQGTRTGDEPAINPPILVPN